MNRIEVVVLAVGFLAIVAALAAVDWRIGLFTFGAGLIASTIDLRRRA